MNKNGGKIMRLFRTVTLISILLFISGMAFAQTKATITLPDIETTAGASIDVPVKVSTTYSIGIAQVVIEYDSTVLTYVSAEI